MSLRTQSKSDQMSSSDANKVPVSSGLNPVATIGIIGAMMTLYSLQSLLITASKSGGAGYSYDPNSVVLMTEFTKAIIAGTLLLQARASDPMGTKITVNKTVFNNIKIIVTGLLYRTFLKKPLRVVQWIGLAVLMLGQMVATMDTSGGGTDTSARTEAFATGCVVMGVLASMSGMAGVYTDCTADCTADCNTLDMM